MTDWSKSYAIEYRLYKVDDRTWAEAEHVAGLRSAHIERTAGSLMESASIEITGADLSAGYYRISALVEQNGVTELHHIGTFHCLMSEGNLNRGIDAASIVGRSVLYPAKAKRLDRGYTAPIGCDGVDFAASMLEEVLKAPVEASGAFRLDDGHTFEIGMPVLDGVWRILNAGGWCIQIDGGGSVAVVPKPTYPALSLDGAGVSLLMPSVAHRADYSEVYNTYTAIDGINHVKIVNDDPTSPTSTVSLGFEHDAPFDTSPMRVNGETLAAYASRRLAESSVVSDSRTYTREYQPEVLPFSIVRGTVQSVGTEADMRVSKQAIDIHRGSRLKVTEQADSEVRTWLT